MNDERSWTRLQAFAAGIPADATQDDVLELLVDNLHNVLGLTAASARAVDQAWCATAPADDIEIAMLDGVQYVEQVGPALDALRNNEPVAAATTEEARTHWPLFADAMASAGVQAVAAVPLAHVEGTRGMALLVHATPHAWESEELGMAAAFAAVGAAHLAHLESAHRHATTAQELQLALDSRVLVEQAKGVLSVVSGLTVDEAFDQIRRLARSSRRRVDDVAREVVHDGLRPTTAAPRAVPGQPPRRRG